MPRTWNHAWHTVQGMLALRLQQGHDNRNRGDPGRTGEMPAARGVGENGKVGAAGRTLWKMMEQEKVILRGRGWSAVRTRQQQYVRSY